MPRVIGIDPGTVSIDVCGLEDGRVFLDRSLPTGAALAAPREFVALLQSSGAVDLIAGPSGYGLPLVAVRDLAERDLRLACLAAEGEPGGIGGLRSLMRLLADSMLPVVLTPGVVHLPSVPAHRKVNRIDMGTADKVCAAVLAIHQQAARLGCAAGKVSLVLLELGGAFTAAVAVVNGQIVDGIGGTSGPIGVRAAGALDGEVAFLAGEVSKGMLFQGGAATIAGTPDASPETIAAAASPRAALAWAALLESAAKAVAALWVAAPDATEVILSGRLARVPGVRGELERRLSRVNGRASIRRLDGLASTAKEGAQGAALLADGLAGGACAPLIDTLGVRQASGTVLDHLYVLDPGAARRRIGISG
jgi:predicted butyrate kinase (DUF1464 family)